MAPTDDLRTLATQYLAALERGTTGADLAAFFSEDVIQEEFPNRLMPTGARRDLAAILDGAVRGQQLMAAQRYAVLSSLVDGNQVVLEVQWTGTLAISVGSIPAGGEMRARFAVFLTYRDGKIAHQRNYDCFEPW